LKDEAETVQGEVSFVVSELVSRASHDLSIGKNGKISVSSSWTKLTEEEVNEAVKASEKQTETV